MSNPASIAPSLAPRSMTREELARICRFASHCVLDRKRDWILPPSALPAIQNATGPANLISHGTGTCALAEINSSEICGVTLDTTADSHGALWLLPDDIDVAEDLKVAVLWSNSEAAGTGSGQFVAVYTPLTAGTTAMAVGATALDTVIANQADKAANVVQWSPWGILAGGTLTGTPGLDLAAWKISVTLTTIANATLYGVIGERGRRYI